MADEKGRDPKRPEDATEQIKAVTTEGGLLADAGGTAGLTEAAAGERPTDSEEVREEASGGTSPLRGTDTGLEGGDRR